MGIDQTVSVVKGIAIKLADHLETLPELLRDAYMRYEITRRLEHKYRVRWYRDGTINPVRVIRRYNDPQPTWTASRIDENIKEFRDRLKEELDGKQPLCYDGFCHKLYDNDLRRECRSKYGLSEIHLDSGSFTIYIYDFVEGLLKSGPDYEELFTDLPQLDPLTADERKNGVKYMIRGSFGP